MQYEKRMSHTMHAGHQSRHPPVVRPGGGHCQQLDVGEPLHTPALVARREELAPLALVSEGNEGVSHGCKLTRGLS